MVTSFTFTYPLILMSIFIVQFFFKKSFCFCFFSPTSYYCGTYGTHLFFYLLWTVLKSYFIYLFFGFLVKSLSNFLNLLLQHLSCGRLVSESWLFSPINPSTGGSPTKLSFFTKQNLDTISPGRWHSGPSLWLYAVWLFKSSSFRKKPHFCSDYSGRKTKRI